MQAYLRVNEGVIIDGNSSTVFPLPLEPGEWKHLTDEEVILVIHHDGDPLFLLTRETGKRT
jgi:hypothetical protein